MEKHGSIPDKEILLCITIKDFSSEKIRLRREAKDNFSTNFEVKNGINIPPVQ
jgi:hypothetical protein